MQQLTIANIDQDNDAVQGNANEQTQNGSGAPNGATTSTILEDPSDPSNTQEAELENEADQENEAEINQGHRRTVCKGFAVFCDNTAVNNRKYRAR